MKPTASCTVCACAVASLLISGYVTGRHGCNSPCEPVGQLTEAAWTATGISSSTSASEHVVAVNSRLLGYGAGEWVDLG